jgi:biotin carboxyl carrier protein
VTIHTSAGGRTRAVTVNRKGDAFLVSIDGRACEVDVKVINGVWSMLIGPAKAGPYGSRSYEVGFSTLAGGAMTVHVDGIPVEVSINQMRRFGGGASSHPAGEGPQTVTAPMPGKIVKLLVRPGDRVQPRQGVVVVEAMKMENELRARAAGTVSEVRVTEGSSVEAGAILVILE